jgi:hypothetical protein
VAAGGHSGGRNPEAARRCGAVWRLNPLSKGGRLIRIRRRGVSGLGA